MRLTDAVAWTPSDFAAMAALLLALGIGIDLALRRPDPAFRAAAALALATGFLLLWAHGAVGIVRSEAEPAIRFSPLVPAAAVAGALLARGRPARLAGA